MKRFNVKRCVAAGTLALTTILGGSSLLMHTMPTPVYAVSYDDTVTPSGIADMGDGSASILIQNYNHQSLMGKQFEIYKLFDAENAVDGESINYTWNEDYKEALQQVVGAALSKDADSVTEYDVIDYIQTLNNHQVEGANADQTLEGRYSDFRYFVEDVRNAMVDLGMQGTTVTVTATDANGNVTLTGLDYGYYIIDEVTQNAGTHSASSLCIVDTANPAAEVQVKSDYPSIIKKINEDDNEVGWNDIADYEIGQTVPYKYETNVPNMNGYHTYYFAMHDSMDEEITFNPQSVSIVIDNGTKQYTLAENEYRVNTSTSDGDTFDIEIDDLKAIVDREYPEGMNSDHENTYGQLITVTFDATLNDLAANDTGRPGFENDVKLEFSNNPDSDGTGQTGETPWDTVVCFTYKLDVTKINNHNKLLANAKFRLYSDEACTQEVYVKKTENGYNVINRDSLGGNDHTGGNRPGSAVEMVSDENGNFVIYGLDQGTYWLKETDSPAGYRELLDPIELTLTPTFTDLRNTYVAGQGATDAILQNLSATAHTKEFYNGAYTENTVDLETNADEGVANITVVNQVGSKLPITGSNMTMIMLGAGLVIMGGSLAYWKKKKSSADKVDAQ